jgi:hypothetical protein
LQQRDEFIDAAGRMADGEEGQRHARLLVPPSERGLLFRDCCAENARY